MTDGPGRPQADRARLRLAREIISLPRWGSSALWERLRSRDPQASTSSGALVSYLRLAMLRGESQAARDLFVLLLGRVEGINRSWAFQGARRAMDAGGDPALREDLLQELTLYLWRELARRDDESWEIYFTRALGFAQRHVLTAYMERNGYWRARDVAGPSRGIATPFSRLAARCESDDHDEGEWPRLVAPADGMVAAELADLRALVERPPKRQRAVVIMRYWQDARENEIAATLGVTPRAVRAMLTRAYAKLRAAYEGAER
jgi:RNA polymerase sigma factor (sigma-70 family)